MKRLVISPHDPAEFLGGTERVVRAMVDARRRRGEEIVLFAGSERFEPQTRVESRGEPGLAVHRVIRAANETGEVFLRPGVRAEFERIVDAVVPDVVEWHHGATLSLDLVRCSIERGLPTIVFLHDLWLSCPRFFRIAPQRLRCPQGSDRGACEPCCRLDLPWDESRLHAWIAAFAENARAELLAADHRIAPSRAHGERLASFFPEDPVDFEVVPHGLLDGAIPPPPRAARDAGWLRVAHFGNLVPEKGLEDLARALSALAQPERVSLEIWGAELRAGFVDEIRALSPRSPIVHHDAYPNFRAIAAEVAQCDLAAFPSRAPESYGLVVDEALAAGLPVLVSDRGALSERAGGAGEVLAAEEPRAWRDALQRFLDQPARLDALRGALPATQRTIEQAVDDIDEIVGLGGVR